MESQVTTAASADANAGRSGAEPAQCSAACGAMTARDTAPQVRIPPLKTAPGCPHQLSGAGCIHTDAARNFLPMGKRCLRGARRATAQECRIAGCAPRFNVLPLDSAGLLK